MRAVDDSDYGYGFDEIWWWSNMYYDAGSESDDTWPVDGTLSFFRFQATD